MKLVELEKICDTKKFNEIKYHKDITKEQARKLFDFAFEDYIDTIITDTLTFVKKGRKISVIENEKNN